MPFAAWAVRGWRWPPTLPAELRLYPRGWLRAKLYVFLVIWKSGLAWLVILALVTVIGLFYYLRIVRYVHGPARDRSAPRAFALLSAVVILCLAMTVGLGSIFDLSSSFAVNRQRIYWPGPRAKGAAQASTDPVSDLRRSTPCRLRTCPTQPSRPGRHLLEPEPKGGRYSFLNGDGLQCADHPVDLRTHHIHSVHLIRIDSSALVAHRRRCRRSRHRHHR